MKIAVSNIAWGSDKDEEMLAIIKEMGFSAVEIAPTRLISDLPYSHCDKAKQISREFINRYGLSICSMQSIWYGRKERIAESKESYDKLVEYTKEAVLFAKSVNCRNLVFGCPRNRMVNTAEERKIVIKFLDEIASYAYLNDVVIALEPNPAIYNTNFSNRTEEVINLLKQLNNPGLKINLDFGTIIENEESVHIIENCVDMISHVHISEPYLKPVKPRREHKLLKDILVDNNYKYYVSLEMSKTNSDESLLQSLHYIKKIFN